MAKADTCRAPEPMLQQGQEWLSIAEQQFGQEIQIQLRLHRSIGMVKNLVLCIKV